MQVLASAAVAMVVGLALGGLAPRSEIRSLKSQVEDLQDKDCGTRGVGREIASAFQGEPWKAALDEDEAAALDRARDGQNKAEEPEEEKDGLNFEWKIGDDGEVDPEDLEQGLQMAKDAMAMREAQARAALDEQVQPSDEQWDDIDAALDTMNDDLNALARGFVDSIADGQEPSRREAMMFASDTLDVLLDADDQIWNTLDADQRAAVEDEAIDPMAHIDPALIDIFMELDQ
jgi:hypothetical protein